MVTRRRVTAAIDQAQTAVVIDPCRHYIKDTQHAAGLIFVIPLHLIGEGRLW
jgi:hypothetical protein